MLSQRHRVAIRRHLGAPFANTAVAGRLFGWRFAIHVEDLEYKMSNLAASEEQLITGNSMGSWQIGGSPQVGDILQFKINDGNANPTVTYTVQQSDLTQIPDPTNPQFTAPVYMIALNVGSKINQVAQQYGYAATGSPASDFFTQYLPPTYGEVILTMPASLSGVTITASVTGVTTLVVGQQVAPCPVQATLVNTATKQTKTYYGYVDLLDALQMGPAQANLSLWLTKADVAEFRQNEVSARRSLYRFYCEELSRNLGGQEYIDQFFGGGGGVIA